MGYAGLLAMEPTNGSFDANSECYEFLSESMKKTGVILDTSGIRGTRSHHSNNTRTGPYEVGGSITIVPHPAGLDLILPRIMGAAESTDTFALADGLNLAGSQYFGLMVDRVAKVFTYAGCLIDKAIFRGQAGGFVELQLDIIGQSESVGNAGSFPAITPSVAANAAPYVFTDGVCTLVSSARVITEFEVTIDNQLRRRMSNSLTATSIDASDRIVTCKFKTPYTSSETDLYGQALAGSAATLVLTNGNMSTTMTFATIQFPDNSPTITGKDEIPLELEGIARMSSTTKELVVTHDSTA